MLRIRETIRGRWKLVVIPALALSLAGAISGPVNAEQVFDWDRLELYDADYQVISASHHGDCDCAPRCPSDCDPCAPGTDSSSRTTDESSDTDISDDLMTDSPRQIAGGQVGYRGNPSLPGYIDDAFIRSRVRVRYDNLQGANEPTRAEMWYPTLGVFGGPGPAGGGAGQDPLGSDSDKDFQELSTYVEAAFSDCFSVFGEFPVRWVEPVVFDPNDPNDTFLDGTQAGAGDIRAGVRYGLVALPEEALTLQVRAWAPTGEARRGLGVGHSSIDVAMLYSVRTSQRTSWFAEIQDWQTIDAGVAEDPNFPDNTIDLDANVLRYGVGFGYDLWQSCGCRPQTLTGLFEVVGWTVLDGAITPTSFDPSVTTVPVDFQDASGDTIVNGKYGLRYNWNCGCHGESVYVGYGHNWTDDRWYSDVFRLEFTHFF